MLSHNGMASPGPFIQYELQKIICIFDIVNVGKKGTFFHHLSNRSLIQSIFKKLIKHCSSVNFKFEFSFTQWFTETYYEVQ